MPRSPADDRHDLRQSRTVLLATDNQHSVIAKLAGGKPSAIAYTAYGQQSPQQDVMGLGFNGELREARLGWYLLGNGYRAYNPVLMRFHSPDSWSPFGEGGLNAYMYCAGDPVNFLDPTGHMNFFRRSTSPNLTAINTAAAERRPRQDVGNTYQRLPSRRPAATSTPITETPTPQTTSSETVSYEEYFSERSVSSSTRAGRSQSSTRQNPQHASPRPSDLTRQSSNGLSGLGIAVFSNPISDAPPLPPRLNLPTPPPLPPRENLPPAPPLPLKPGPPLPPRRFRDGTDQQTQTMRDVRRAP